jgi:hypothetical protein
MSSEVARLRQQIERECQAIQQGFSGYAEVAKHKAITHKYNSFGSYQEELARIVGDEKAALIAAKIYMEVMG